MKEISKLEGIRPRLKRRKMENTEFKYQQILQEKWPQETENRPKMSLQERAKIFLPFAALKGYEESLEEVAKCKEKKNY